MTGLTYRTTRRQGRPASGWARLELPQVLVDVLAADRALVGTVQPPLELGLDAGHGRVEVVGLALLDESAA